MSNTKVNTSKSSSIMAKLAKLAILFTISCLHQQDCPLSFTIIKCVNAQDNRAPDSPSLVLVEPVDGSTVLPAVQLSMRVTLPPSYNAQDHHVCMEVVSLSFDARSLG